MYSGREIERGGGWISVGDVLSLTLMDKIVLIDGFVSIVSVELWFDEMAVWTARKGVLIFTDTSIFSFMAKSNYPYLELGGIVLQ